MAAWLALIPLILKVFEVISEQCMEERLERAAAKLPPPATFGSDGAASDALFDKAISMTRRPFVKVGLRQMKAAAVVDGKIRTTTLTADEIAEGAEILSAVNEE